MNRNLTRLAAIAAAALALSAGPAQAQATGAEGFGDFVWSDLNHNGVQDAGEPGIGSVTVNLFSSADNFTNIFMSADTNASGVYFLDIGSGAVNHSWQLQFILPSGFQFTLADQGANDALDSDVIDALTGRTAIVQGFTFPTSGAPILTVDAGLVAVSVPEPGSLALVGAALAALLAAVALRRPRVRPGH